MAYTDDDEEAPTGGLADARPGPMSATGKAQLRKAYSDSQGALSRQQSTYDQLQQQRQEQVQQQRAILDKTIADLMAARQTQGVTPLLAAGAGFFSPTRTGSTGESVGNALRGLVPELNREEQGRSAIAQQVGNLQFQGAGLEGGLLKEQQHDLVRRMVSGERSSALLANALAKAERGPMQYAPSMLKKMMDERNALPEGDPRRDLYDGYIKALSTRGELTPAQRTRLDAQTLRTVDSQVAAAMRVLDKEYSWETPDARKAEETRIRQEITARYEGAPVGARPQTAAVPVSEPSPTLTATPVETAQMPNVTITTEPRQTPPPIASPSPSALPKGPMGATVRLPSGEEKAQRDLLTNAGIGLNMIDEISAPLSKETGVSTTTGIGGGLQRAYNNTLGQVFGNASKEDAALMSKMAALKPILQKAVKVDSNMSKDERKDLESILGMWDKFTSRDTILTNLKSIRDILGRQQDAARTRRGPRANEPVQTEEKKRLRYNQKTGDLE